MEKCQVAIWDKGVVSNGKSVFVANAIVGAGDDRCLWLGYFGTGTRI